ncbi:hypothetical protein [Pseudomonas umsongensis]|uniref:hypothetical protein n=1 Tax=Pseudomonas umsongensis TaxID=198618 RepID=UPI0015BE9E56|nr:hypothetical protein [Pseudomonas umsongensis]
MLAMEFNDDAAALTPSGVLRFIASRLSYKGFVVLRAKKNAPNQSGRQVCSAAVSFL